MSPSSFCGRWKPSGLPGLKPTDDISRICQTEVEQRGRGETRRKAFVADQDHADVVVGSLGDPRWGGGVETPLQDGAVDDHRAWNFPIRHTLFRGAGVD